MRVSHKDSIIWWLMVTFGHYGRVSKASFRVIFELWGQTKTILILPLSCFSLQNQGVQHSHLWELCLICCFSVLVTLIFKLKSGLFLFEALLSGQLIRCSQTASYFKKNLFGDFLCEVTKLKCICIYVGCSIRRTCLLPNKRRYHFSGVWHSMNGWKLPESEHPC